MKIFDVPLTDLRRIAETLRSPATGIEFQGDDISNGAGIRVQGKLRPKAGFVNPYPRISASFFSPSRAVNGVCWHGHRDFMRAVFNEFPTARITSNWYGKIDFRGKEDFESNYAETGLIKIGAPICDGYPRLSDACKCPEAETNY